MIWSHNNITWWQQHEQHVSKQEEKHALSRKTLLVLLWPSCHLHMCLKDGSLGWDWPTTHELGSGRSAIRIRKLSLILWFCIWRSFRKRKKKLHIRFKVVGQESLYIYNTWELDVAERIVATLWMRFTAIVQPKTTHRLNRFNLQKYRQKTVETVAEYMTRCKLQQRNTSSLTTRILMSVS